MRPRLGPVVLLLLAVSSMVPTAQAALNGPRPYEADPAKFGYMPGFGGPAFTMASGRLDATIPSGEGTWGFFATGGTAVGGLSKACWTEGLTRPCAFSAGGLAVHVMPGGSFGLRFPTGADARIEAAHALGMFVDLATTGDVNSLDLELSLVAPVVQGQAVFTAIPAIPDTLLDDPTSDAAGAVAAAEPRTVIEVREGATVLARLEGKVPPVTFSGRPTVSPIAMELAVVPFRGGSAVARFEPASSEDAAIGLDLARINRLMSRLYAANEGEATEADDIPENSFGPFQDAAGTVFGGAVLSIPNGAGASLQDFAFARTSSLMVQGTSGDGLSWTGKATLDLHDGHVEGGQPLYGFGFVALPWWGWLLWIAAITVFIVRLVRKPDKKNPKWDRFKWVGWIAGPLVMLLVFFLWDLEMRAVLGVSLLSGKLSGQLLVLVGALQLATLALLSFAAIAPLRILLRNTSLLLHQGTFMGLAGAAAGLLGFLIGFGLLRSGFDLVLAKALEAYAAALVGGGT